MSTSSPLPPPPRGEWVRRCAEKILELDDVVSASDAHDLAHTLSELPSCQHISPEEAAMRLFRDDLTPSRWNLLTDLLRPGSES